MNVVTNIAVAPKTRKGGAKLLLAVIVAVVGIALVFGWFLLAVPPRTDSSVAAIPQPRGADVPAVRLDASRAVSGKPSPQEDLTATGFAISEAQVEPARRCATGAALRIDKAQDALRDLMQVASGQWTSKGEQARAINQVLPRLVALGEEAVPEIQALLEEGEDIRFEFFTPDGEGLSYGKPICRSSPSDRARSPNPSDRSHGRRRKF